MSSKLTVAKLVSTATPTAWSQAYHAGGFTAVLSLVPDNSSQASVEETELHKAGKEILDTLIAEYFTLTTKDLETVKGAVEVTAQKIPPGMKLSLVVGATVRNVLYIVIANSGKAFLKRGEKTGTLLEVTKDTEQAIESVSGYLEHGDVVVLETKQFQEVVPEHELLESLSPTSVADLAESLAPRLHEKQQGDASAIIFSYHEDVPSVLEKTPSPTPLKEEKLEEKRAPDFFAEETKMNEFHEPTAETVKGDAIHKKGFHFSHSQKLFLTISVVLAAVLFSSIYFFISREQTAKRQALFQSIFTSAQTKYKEGQGLMDLNKDLAMQDFQSAKDTLSSGVNKFPQGSSEQKQIQKLLDQVNQSLQTEAASNLVQATKAADNASPLLSFAASHPTTTYVATDGTNFYTADSTGVTKYAKGATKGTTVITGTWKKLGGFGMYFGNAYLLDTTDGISKYAPAGSSFGKPSAYFTTTPDVSQAVSLAIDGSIWVLGKDGSVSKFTKGVQDSFSLTGLNKPLSSPTQIVTSLDDNNLYILDRGNGRVVEVQKTGGYVTDYQAGIIKSADMIDVDEKNKLLYILSGGTVYQISLK